MSMMLVNNIKPRKKLSSRVKFLKMTLTSHGMSDAQRALDLMIEEMCAEKGYKRHNGSDYFTHPADVAMKLLNFGVRDQVTIIGALLHDAIEDIPWITYEYIEREFGEEAAKVVKGVTKDPNVDYKVNPEKFEEDLEIMLLDLRMALIKTADRIHNFNTLGDAPLDKQLRKALETEKYFIPFFKKCREEYPEFAHFFLQAKTEIEPHLESIKASHAREQALKAEIAYLKGTIAANNGLKSEMGKQYV